MPSEVQSTWITPFVVSSFLVDSNKKLSLHGLISLMQETAWTHASHLGHGYARTRAEGGSWVIARQRIELQEWPKWEEQFTIKTWLRPPGAVIVTRDFEFFVGQRKVGEATAHWLTISHSSRRPTKLPFPDNPALFRQHEHLSIEPLKLGMTRELQRLCEFTVRPSDLDMNGHVNNTRFAQWVLDSLPLDFHTRHRVAGYQTNFLAEVRPGDGLFVSGSHFSSGGGPQEVLFQGRRENNGEILFNALVETQEIRA